MAEFINKTKFEELMRKKARNNFDLYYADKSKHYHDNAIGYNMAADEAHDFPAEDVQPVKRGKWHECYTDSHHYSGICSACGKASIKKLNERLYDYCPRCGADMREKEGE